MIAQGTGALIVQSNVMELQPANPLRNERCGTVSYFNNTDPGGTLLRGYNTITTKKYVELADEAEDALMLALLKKG